MHGTKFNSVKSHFERNFHHWLKLEKIEID